MLALTPGTTEHGADCPASELRWVLAADCPNRNASLYERCQVHFPNVPDPAPWIRATAKGNPFDLGSGEDRCARAGFTEEQIIGIIREYEAGAKLPELCRRHNVAPTTFSKWRAGYGGMTASDANLPRLEER